MFGSGKSWCFGHLSMRGGIRIGARKHHSDYLPCDLEKSLYNWEVVRVQGLRFG